LISSSCLRVLEINLLVLGAALCATRRETFATQNRPAGLGLEGHAVALAALIANNFEAFAFAAASSATLSLAAKVSAPRIAAGLTALGMCQSAFTIIILLSFRKRKGRSALGASDFEIWHGRLP
jgi:hypothetical protein